MINYPTIHGVKINISNGNVSIPANTTFSLSFDGYFNDYNRIETGFLYILATFSGSPESCLYVTMNGHTEKSHSFFDNSKSIYWLVIDLTHFLRFGWHWQLSKYNPLTGKTSGSIARWLWWCLLHPW